MTTDELFSIFLRHKHTGSFPDASKILKLDVYTIILISPSGYIFKLAVDDDGVLTTEKIG